MNRKFEDLKEFEEKINYKFKNRNYLISALTHSSYANEVRIPGIVNNERLEFLGDAVLELATSAKIFKKYPNIRLFQYSIIFGEAGYSNFPFNIQKSTLL